MGDDGSIVLSNVTKVKPLWSMKFYLDLETEAAPEITYEPVNALAVVVGINHWQDITGPFVRSLVRHNPNLPVLVVDNASKTPYPLSDDYTVLRLEERVGYNLAMNHAMRAAPGKDWYILFNNDCMCHGYFAGDIAKLDPKTVYGSGWNEDKKNGVHLQWSAWLCISKQARKEVGLFDKQFTGAYEDFDYQMMATKKGYKLDTFEIPVKHLDKHTRFEEHKYIERQTAARDLFAAKHKMKI
jgi:GT2 family glycosyltransferase